MFSYRFLRRKSIFRLVIKSNGLFITTKSYKFIRNRFFYSLLPELKKFIALFVLLSTEMKTSAKVFNYDFCILKIIMILWSGYLAYLIFIKKKVQREPRTKGTFKIMQKQIQDKIKMNVQSRIQRFTVSQCPPFLAPAPQRQQKQRSTIIPIIMPAIFPSDNPLLLDH